MKVLIIGFGSIAKKHVKAMQRFENLNIFALRSSLDAEEHTGVTNVFSFEGIKQNDFDFFLISNPTAKHFETIQKILQFKKTIFIEKPLFSDVGKKQEQLVGQITEKQIHTYIGCNLRFLHALKEIKRMLPKMRINEINCYSGSYLPEWRPNTDFRKTYSARKDLGGGVHIDLIHELDYLFWMFGSPHKTIARHSSKSSLQIDAIDYANYFWEYKDFCSSVILNYYRRDTKRTFEIVAEEGTYLVDLMQNTISFNGKEIFASEQRLIDTFDDQMDFFINEILTGKQTDFNSVEEAYKILQLCLKE